MCRPTWKSSSNKLSKQTSFIFRTDISARKSSKSSSSFISPQCEWSTVAAQCFKWDHVLMRIKFALKTTSACEFFLYDFSRVRKVFVLYSAKITKFYTSTLYKPIRNYKNNLFSLSTARRSGDALMKNDWTALLIFIRACDDDESTSTRAHVIDFYYER